VNAADVAAELERLGEQVIACTRCDLHRTATRGVPGEGPANADVMLVGEAPGANEDKQGRPFVGAAGKFLDQTLLPLAGLSRDGVYITNVVKHRPPENRPPAPDELTACRPYLDRQIDLIKPRVIVTLGRFSLGTFFPGDMISRVHGQVRRRDERFYFHMYHPAAALHQESLRKTLEDDMKRLGAFLQSPTYRDASPAGTSDGNEDEGDPPEQLSFF
jgi:uracil-DNA glycosylase family 4